MSVSEGATVLRVTPITVLRMIPVETVASDASLCGCSLDNCGARTSRDPWPNGTNQ
jgi:hypothetical protein